MEECECCGTQLGVMAAETNLYCPPCEKSGCREVSGECLKPQGNLARWQR